MPRARYFTFNDRSYRREKIVKARQEGANLRELVERYGLSPNWTRTIIREAGMPSRRREKYQSSTGGRAATQDSRPVN